MGTRVKTAAWVTLPVVTALLASDSASAQWRVVQPQSQQQETTRYYEMDTNGDGVITRTEWRGTRQAFIDADINQDGVLSGTEVRAVDQTVGTTGTTVRDRRSRFYALDANADGIVSRNEWDGTRAQFNQFDTNRDGMLSQREYIGSQSGVNEPTAVTRQATGPQMVFVDAKTRWTDTGLFVNQGDIIMLNAQGSVQLSETGNDIAAPAGARSGRFAVNAPLPQDLAGALIGRIGDGSPFGVGNLRQITAPATGQLFFGVNDDHLDDNQGGFRVRVNVR